MTITELEENVRKLKIRKDRINCHLIKQLECSSEIGIYVANHNDKWEIYKTERRCARLIGIFYKEKEAYEYVYCYLKKVADDDCWFGGSMWEYPRDLIRKMRRFKIPDSEYSFEGGMQKNCLCVEKKFAQEEILHDTVKGDEIGFDIDMESDYYLKKEDGKVEIWEVYYSDGIKKEKYGIFFQEKNAYNFLFYLVMKKHVSIEKRWWYF